MRAPSADPAATFTARARRLGVVAAFGTLALLTTYGLVLAVALRALPSPLQPIGDPLFSILELLILLAMPPLVALMVAVHAWAAPDVKVYGLLALIFATLLAGLTSCVHFVILAVSRQPAFADAGGMPLLLSFTWPSVAYALDVLAWDVFFALAALCAAPVFRGGRLASAIRVLLIGSGLLALAGLSGAVVGDMQLRNIGILGYAVLFPVAVLLIGLLFHRAPTRPV